MQVVGYDTGLADLEYDPLEGFLGEAAEPALLIGEDGSIRRESLAAGVELAYTLESRHCAGVLADDEHYGCDAEAAPHCADHQDDWPCARCIGNCDKPLPSCEAEHAVYLAGFAPDILKVGVTRLNRLPERLREQGADRAAHLHTVSDGRIARRIEGELATELPDRVSTATKLAGIAEPFDDTAWAEAIDRYEAADTFSFDYGLELTERPLAETLVTGTVVGTKGRLLLVDRGGGTYAVDLRDLIGYELEPGASDQDVQANLGTFG